MKIVKHLPPNVLLCATTIFLTIAVKSCKLFSEVGMVKGIIPDKLFTGTIDDLGEALIFKEGDFLDSFTDRTSEPDTNWITFLIHASPPVEIHN